MADPLWDKAQLDPTYIAGHAGLRNSMLQAFLANGDTSMLTPELMSQWGISQADIAPAAINPYSAKAGLERTLGTNQGQIRTGVVGRGLERSGAHAVLQAREIQNANQRNYASQQGLLSTINGIGQQNTDLITGAYRTLMGQAAADPTIPAAPAPAPVPAPAAAPAPAGPALNGLGTPYIDPGQRESLVQPIATPTVKALTAAQLAAQAKRGFQGHA